jgi:DNA-binding transcriptional regulator YiaG
MIIKFKDGRFQTDKRQATIARELGVSQGTISNWLNLSVKPSGLSKTVLAARYPELLTRIEMEWRRKDG